MSIITPGQTNTSLVVDVPERVCIDSWWGGMRKARQIGGLSAGSKGIDSAVTRNMRFWPSTGCWTLKPMQEKFSSLYETEIEGFIDDIPHYKPGGGTSLTDLYVGVVGAYIETKLWREPNGVGFVHQPHTRTEGDPIYRRAVAAGTSWVSGLDLSPPPPQLTNTDSYLAGIPEFNSPAVPMDCVFYSKREQKPNQGFYLRWRAPGLAASAPDVVLNFYFGQYCLIIGGSGDAIIAEWCQPYGGGAFRWKKRDTFRYCKQGRAVGNWHAMIVFPHKGPKGEKYIVFSGNEMDTTGAPGILSAEPAFQSAVIDEKKYHANELVRFNDLEEDPENVTKAGRIRMDTRQDLHIGWHISPLMFLNKGGIVDSAWSTPDYTVRSIATSDYPAKPFSVNVRADYPPDPRNGAFPGIAVAVKDANNPAALDIRTPFAQFVFSGTGSSDTSASYTTPIMWGYELFREATNRDVNPGQLSTKLHSLSLNGLAGPDPRQERGSVMIKDVTASVLTPLGYGARLAARVAMDYTAPGEVTPKKVVLFRGYASRPKGELRGKPGKVYPSENWRDYSVLLSGIADRASAVSGRTIDYAHFEYDPLATPATTGPMKGVPLAWKVTDVIRYLLQQRGFPEDQVLIPDNEIRLWSGSDAFNQDSVYNANTDVIAQCVALARNYLSAYLIWDANAGPLDSAITGNSSDKTPQGAWRLVFPPSPSATPVYHFVTSQQITMVGGKTVLPVSPAAYNENTTFLEGHLQAYNVPPEANHVWCFTAPPLNGTSGWKVDAHAHNPRSYAVPGMTVQPAPSNPIHRPQYLGYEHMLVVPDASLTELGDLKKIQRAVNFTARRIFDYACRARQIIPAHAPLVIITDAATGRPRPLRYYDPITINGESGWYVRSVSPSITSPNHMADYEFERVIPIVLT